MSDIKSGTTSEYRSDPEPMIHLEHVVKAFDAKRRAPGKGAPGLDVIALDDVTLHIPRGELVAIARALSVYPPILLADEPTGNLDTRSGEDILTLIRDLHVRLGSTIVIVTHDLTVARSCERTIALRDGRLVQDTRHVAVRAAADV